MEEASSSVITASKYENQTAAQTERSAGRPPPASLNENSPIGWAKTNLFGSIGNSITTLVIIAALIYAVLGVLNWAVFEAIFRVDNEACRAASGACWGVIGEKWRVMIFGRYPEELWRPISMIVLLIGIIVWSLDPARWNRALGIAWCIAIPAIFVLLGGTLSYWLWPFLILAVGVILGLSSQLLGYLVLGALALLVLPTLTWVIDTLVGGGGALHLALPDAPNLLTPVDTSLWGGLPLTLLLATVGIGLSFPLAIMLALGRQSNLPIIKALCIGFIELIRGVPLITILFMAVLMIPLFLPEGVNADQLIRAQLGFIFFSAAYVAEVIRGGLAAIPKGQYEAADALGLPYWYKTIFIVLPQALKLVIMPMMNTFIGLFKDTSLVYIISMFDLVGAVNSAMTDPEWRKFHIEGLVFIAVIYFVFCYSMARYAENLERSLDKSNR